MKILSMSDENVSIKQTRPNKRNTLQVLQNNYELRKFIKNIKRRAGCGIM